MSRSIHKTVAQVARENSKADLAEPDNSDVAALAQKVGYKKAERLNRLMKKGSADRRGQDPG